MLRAEGLSLRADGAVELASVSFAIERASLAAIVGPDAWDKDALVDLLQGRRRPTHGTLRLAGRPVTALAPAERVRRGLVWTVRPPLELSTSTLVEGIVLAMSAPRPPSPLDFLRRQPSEPSTAAAVEALQFVGLGSRSGAAPGQLEGLDRARLELARALAAKPRLLVVDRLGSLVPAAERLAFVSLLRHVAAYGVTVLWIEDDALLALDHADHVIALRHGRTLVPGALDKSASRDALEAAFLGQTR